MHYTQQQIERANAVNLEDFLKAQGEELVQSGREKRWKAHDSLTVRGSKWFRHSAGTGGYPVDFVMEMYGKSFPEAMEMLIGEKGEGQQESVSAPSQEFRLPQRNVTDVNAENYLAEGRGLRRDLIRFFMGTGDVYEESEYHNVVFVGRDRKHVPRWAHRRGITGKFRQDVCGSDKSYGFSYQGSGSRLYVFEAPIDMLSFIDLFRKDWQKYSYLSLGGTACGSLERYLREHEAISEVYLCLDHDDAGEKACRRIAMMLPDGITVTRVRPVRKDWNEVLCGMDEIKDGKLYEIAEMTRGIDTGPIVPMLKMSDIEEIPVEFLWRPYIPFGKLTILQGDPGTGKTYMSMQLCAACTNRIPLPNMDTLEPFNVIYQTAEDGLGDTVKPRLREAGADLDRVLVIDEAVGGQLTLSDDRIERAIIQNNARLFVVDPIQAYIGENIDMNRANEVRPILRSLAEVAQRNCCAILLVGHLNKSEGMQSTYRGLGSIDLTASARSVLCIGNLKEDPNIRVMTHDKSSLAPSGISIAFVLGGEDGFRWIGEYEITTDELLRGTAQKSPTKLSEAKEMICSMLADGREMLNEELTKEINSKGISDRTIRAAKKALGTALKSRTIEEHRKVYWME
ncbi:Protein of unknown function [Eubacterium pyruvativorans]|uniref:Toprim domain-containing protein n=1 Tax=Eubacterium pyruvativorans TaxID=155865 RepID=A0A1I7IEB3_9FIRM|nr:AAA family ATPase [Eubacterium pyruvativorans]SFO40332.1 Protein of unknown function [Eubacterium pyruvativorans]SFU71252.1 Protein of unknown function [Eubacterium pyruvativorans]